MATKKTKRKSGKPSPAQLRARRLFAERARSGQLNRMATAKKATRKKNALRFKSEADYQKWKARTGSAPKRKRASSRKKPGTLKRLGQSITRGLGMMHNPRRGTTYALGKRGKRESGKLLWLTGPVPKGYKPRRQSKRERRYVRVATAEGIGPGPGRKRYKPARRSKGYSSAPGRLAGPPLGVKLPNPRGQHLPGLPAKYQRMYEDILATSGSKRIAAATTEKEFKRQNPSLFSKLFGRKKRVAKVGYRKTQQGKRRIAPVGYRKTQRGRKINPSAREVFEEFRGMSPTKKIQLTGHGTGKLTVGEAGKLIELGLRGGTKLEFRGQARLCFDGKKRLHIAGVKYPATGYEEDHGEVAYVVYLAKKPKVQLASGDDPNAAYQYKHKFGEDGGRRPRYIVDEEGYPFLEGGDYDIDADGILN